MEKPKVKVKVQSVSDDDVRKSSLSLSFIVPLAADKNKKIHV